MDLDPYAAGGTKLCWDCKQELPLSAFTQDKSRKDGLQYRCRACCKIYSATYNADHVAEVRQYSASYYRSNLEKAAARRARRRTAQTAAGGDRTAEEWRGLLDCTGSTCLLCASTENLVADHVIPVSLGGHSHISNIQPLCRGCNNRKGNRNSNDYRPAWLVEDLRNYVAETYDFID